MLIKITVLDEGDKGKVKNVFSHHWCKYIGLQGSRVLAHELNLRIGRTSGHCTFNQGVITPYLNCGSVFPFLYDTINT